MYRSCQFNVKLAAEDRLSRPIHFTDLVSLSTFPFSTPGSRITYHGFSTPEVAGAGRYVDSHSFHQRVGSDRSLAKPMWPFYTAGTVGHSLCHILC